MGTQAVLHWKTFAQASCAIFAVVLSGAQVLGTEEEERQKSFETPEAAFQALLDGFRQNSDAQILEVLGHRHADLVIQSDQEEAREIRKKICASAQEFLKIESDGAHATAILGLKNWPFPLPLVKRSTGWVFDTAAGKEEILNRRIGRNELHAIAFAEGYLDAQREYARLDRTGDRVPKYAQRLIGSKGKKDGLYWPVEPGSGEEPSPLEAVMEDGQAFREGNGMDVPYFGYHFKVLTKQGSHPPNGKYDYVINGNMIAGFALVAWPADYGASGVMTFVTSHHGILYQKDLGPETAKLTKEMERYNPDETWCEVKTLDRAGPVEGGGDPQALSAGKQQPKE